MSSRARLKRSSCKRRSRSSILGRYRLRHPSPSRRTAPFSGAITPRNSRRRQHPRPSPPRRTSAARRCRLFRAVPGRARAPRRLRRRAPRSRQRRNRRRPPFRPQRHRRVLPRRHPRRRLQGQLRRRPLPRQRRRRLPPWQPRRRALLRQRCRRRLPRRLRRRGLPRQLRRRRLSRQQHRRPLPRQARRRPLPLRRRVVPSRNAGKTLARALDRTVILRRFPPVLHTVLATTRTVRRRRPELAQIRGAMPQGFGLDIKNHGKHGTRSMIDLFMATMAPLCISALMFFWCIESSARVLRYCS